MFGGTVQALSTLPYGRSRRLVCISQNDIWEGEVGGGELEGTSLIE